MVCWEDINILVEKILLKSFKPGLMGWSWIGVQICPPEVIKQRQLVDAWDDGMILERG